MSVRPLDVLDKAKGKRVLLKLKNGTEITGVLQAFDLHLNIWLEEAEERKEESLVKLVLSESNSSHSQILSDQSTGEVNWVNNYRGILVTRGSRQEGQRPPEVFL